MVMSVQCMQPSVHAWGKRIRVSVCVCARAHVLYALCARQIRKEEEADEDVDTFDEIVDIPPAQESTGRL
jgi:hypothetical protein